MERLRCVVLCAFAFLPSLSHSLLVANRLSLNNWGSYSYQDHKGPGTYAYGYEIEDPATGNVQFRQEERHADGTTTGSYGYVGPNGTPQVTYYVSDINGYRILGNEQETRRRVLGNIYAAEKPSIHQLPPEDQSTTVAIYPVQEQYSQPEVYDLRREAPHAPFAYARRR